MNVPAIAKQTFERLKSNPFYLAISQSILSHIEKIHNSREKARFLHNAVDEYNQEVFSHPLLKALVPCRAGCTACCHTQVSTTYEEALLLSDYINEGMEIDLNRLKLQSDQGQDADSYFKLSFQDRKCVFLSEEGSCRVYHDRPMVCRTNAVVGDSKQCDTRFNESSQLRLVKTEKADMAIVSAYLASQESGTLPSMLFKILKEKHHREKPTKKFSLRNLISKSL